MAEGVVHELETVHISHQESHRASRAVIKAPELGFEERPVGEGGEGVVEAQKE